MVEVESCFRTGQLARVLGVSSYQIRRLAETGLIEAEYSGKQWRIPARELERLQRDGVPEIPANTGATQSPPTRPKSPSGHPALFAEPSEQVIEAAEEVVVLENEVKGLGLRRQKEEALDWFREREAEKEERLAAQDQAELERAEAERRRQARAERDSRWLEYALNSVPHEARSEVETELYEEARAALSQVRLGESDAVLERIVDALAARVLRPWTRRQEIRKAVQEASDSLPYQLRGLSWSPTQWDVRAREAAAAAIGELRLDATYGEMVTTAIGAVRPIIAEYEAQEAAEADQKMRQDILRWAFLPAGLTQEGRELATQAIAEALAKHRAYSATAGAG